MWWLIAISDIKMRKVHMERVRRRLVEEHHELTGAGLRSDFDPARPWDACFREAARDQQFWAAEVERKMLQFSTHQKTKHVLFDELFSIDASLKIVSSFVSIDATVMGEIDVCIYSCV